MTSARVALTALLLLLLVLVGIATPAPVAAAGGADQEAARFALLIGNNRGHAGDAQLRFASHDAARVARLLQDLGSFPGENTTVLTARSAEQVRRALLSINDRVRQAVSGGRRAMLLVYYSGHADARTLHLEGTSLEVEELRKLVTGSAATLRVLVLDACHSGSATRVKGGRPGPGFSIRLTNRLTSEGFAIITSSAATEESQESDQLQGSFFTHYLLSGLRGAADRNRDGQVSLAEAYAYAYASTLSVTSRTLVGPQHPTYEYDIRGKGDFMITRLRAAAGHGVLSFGAPGHYLIFAERAEGHVVAELLTDQPRARIVLPAGRYFLRKRAPDLLLEGPLTVRAGARSDVDEGGLRRVAYARLVRKGAGRRRLSHGPLLGYALHGPVAAGLGPLSQLEASYPLALRHVTLAPRVAFGWTSADNDRLTLEHRELTLSLAGHYVLDVGPVGLLVGLVGGYSLALQRFSSAGQAPDRTSHLFSFGGEAGLEWPIRWGLYLQLRGALLTYVFRGMDDALGQSGSTTTALTYGIGAGIGWQLQ